MLHKSRLDEFEAWCRKHGYGTRPGKGEYQVLQIHYPAKGWVPIYEKLYSKEHYTVSGLLVPIVKKFLMSKAEESKICHTDTAPSAAQRGSRESGE